MSSNLPPSSSNQNRLYTRLINILKILQLIGYFFVVFYLVTNFIALIIINRELYNINVKIELFFRLSFSALIACVSIYITTQVLIAIIDLLSRIERNTRP